MANTYTYKPIIQAIQYTGSIDEVIEFIGRESISHLGVDIYTDITTGELTICLYSVATISIKYSEYFVRETFEDDTRTYKTMSEDEFNKYFKELTEPEPIVVDTTPCEDKPTPLPKAKIERYEVAYGEDYYFISSEGKVRTASDIGTKIDIDRWNFGNHFKTEQETKQVRDEWSLQLKYKQWRKQHDPATLDWRNENQEKWDITYDYNILKPWHFCHDASDTCGAFYFSTEQLAERFYAEHKDLIHRALEVGQ